jgi:hypothetical protein
MNLNVRRLRPGSCAETAAMTCSFAIDLSANLDEKDWYALAAFSSFPVDSRFKFAWYFSSPAVVSLVLDCGKPEGAEAPRFHTKSSLA